LGDEKTPNTWSYNFTVSQRTPWRSVAEFQYAGSRSRDLLTTGGNNNGPGSIDFAPLGAYFGVDPITGKTLYNPGTMLPSNFPNLNDFLPYHNYTGITLVGHLSYSNYNAFIATWQKQSGRFTFTSNYTFSKNLGIRDGQTSNGNGDGQDIYPFSIPANYGVLAYDRTHVFNAAYVVNLPTPIHGNKFLGGVVNGWVISGITQWQSGPPLQPNTGGSLNAAWPNDMQPADYLGSNAPLATVPKLICDPRDNLKSNQYFNPACFAPPTGGADGDIIWPYIKGPAFFNSDLAIYKDFLFKEHQKIEFRLSAFNFMNHALWQFNQGGAQDVNLNFSLSSSSSCGNQPAPCGLSQTNINAITTGSPLYKNEVPRVIEFAVKYMF